MKLHEKLLYQAKQKHMMYGKFSEDDEFVNFLETYWYNNEDFPSENHRVIFLLMLSEVAK